MINSPSIGVLVMSYGTPAYKEDVEAYYTHIRKGRKPSDEQLAQLIERYDAIGGTFPLRQHTDQQVSALQRTLDITHQGSVRFQCFQGLKHAVPFVEDGVQAMYEAGITEAVGVVLAPHYSTMSVGSYVKRACTEAERLGIALHCIHSYACHPLLIDLLAQRVQEALQRFSPYPAEEITVLFTAHSLPERILAIQDPYPTELQQTSEAIAQKLRLTNWQFAWQSAGQTGEPWLGPDVLEKIQTLHETADVSRVLVCPIGFVSDHLEVLYDLDVETQAFAAQRGIHFERTRMLNDDPQYMAVLADVIMTQVASFRT